MVKVISDSDQVMWQRVMTRRMRAARAGRLHRFITCITFAHCSFRSAMHHLPALQFPPFQTAIQRRPQAGVARRGSSPGSDSSSRASASNDAPENTSVPSATSLRDNRPLLQPIVICAVRLRSVRLSCASWLSANP